jgi:flavin reductase (DIM6/NTAB) family NADH-FMN oxidoreductase RutF
MSHYPTGVAVVTGRAPDGEPLAMVVGTFSSVSIDPPLVSFMPMKTSKTFERLQNCDSLCINIIGGDQQQELMSIAQRWEQKLDGIRWAPSPAGDPVLCNSLAWIDTTIYDLVEAGDHWIVLCLVKDLDVTKSAPPLLFFQGGYGTFVGNSRLPHPRHDALPAIHSTHSAHDELQELADAVRCEVVVWAALSENEFATIFSALGPGVSTEGQLATRVPTIPPIGDTYVFDKSQEVRDRWIRKIGKTDDTVRTDHLRRLEFLERNRYGVCFLPDEGSRAYRGMIEATREFLDRRLIPSEERIVTDLMKGTTIDYNQRDIIDDEYYDIGSLVFPMRDPQGETTMTLRLAQLPSHVSGAMVKAWIHEAKEVVALIEGDQ